MQEVVSFRDMYLCSTQSLLLPIPHGFVESVSSVQSLVCKVNFTTLIILSNSLCAWFWVSSRDYNIAHENGYNCTIEAIIQFTSATFFKLYKNVNGYYNCMVKARLHDQGKIMPFTSATIPKLYKKRFWMGETLQNVPPLPIQHDRYVIQFFWIRHSRGGTLITGMNNVQGAIWGEGRTLC